jgi:hypothetical protein
MMRTNRRVGHGVVASALLALAVALHALLLWQIGVHQVDLDHDSTISVLAATGHQGAYERLATNRWSTAGEIQRLFQVDEAWPLRRIRDDLARTDIHPPLYFWVLHAVFLAMGTTPWASLALNGLLGVLTILTVYSIGRRLWDSETAAGAALLWAVSYGAMMAASEARPYALSALLSLVLIRLIIPVAERNVTPSRVRGTLITLVMMLGLLTHYHFPFMIAAVGIGLLLAGGGGDRHRRFLLAALPLLAFAGFAFVHPGFVTSLARQRVQTQPFAWDDLLPRLKSFVFGLEGLARPAWSHPFFTWLGLLLLAGVALWAARAGALGRLQGAWGRMRASAPAVRLIAWCALAMIVIEAVLYLGHVIPAHAAGGRYNAALWPLVALLVAGALRELDRDRAALPLLVVAVGLLSYAVALEMDASQQRLVRSPAWRALVTSRAVVADHFQRGLLPRGVLHVRPDTPVWIVRGPADTTLLPAAWREKGVPVTFLLDAGMGDPRVRRVLERAAAGDSLAQAGDGPAGVEVVVWTPRDRTPAAPRDQAIAR